MSKHFAYLDTIIKPFGGDGALRSPLGVLGQPNLRFFQTPSYVWGIVVNAMMSVRDISTVMSLLPIINKQWAKISKGGGVILTCIPLMVTRVLMLIFK